MGKLDIRRPHDLPGADAKTRTTRAAEAQCDLGILAEVRDMAQADFIEIDRALRPYNILPTTLALGGVPHFALPARLANLCDTCARAAMEALTPRKDPRLGVTFTWLDSKRVMPRDQTLTAFVRYNYTAHIDEMPRALEQAGLPLISIRVVLH